MSAMPLKSQVLLVCQKAQPLIQQSKSIVFGTLEKGRIVSKAALNRGAQFGQQYAKAAQQGWETQIASGKLAQLAKERSQQYSKRAVSNGCTALSKAEAFNEIQDFGPPSVESWATAKQAYVQLMRRMQQTHLLDYTWNQVAYGSKVALEIFAFYFIGKALGSGINHAASP